jgi:hemolysin activation/secretion protein
MAEHHWIYLILFALCYSLPLYPFSSLLKKKDAPVHVVQFELDPPEEDLTDKLTAESDLQEGEEAVLFDEALAWVEQEGEPPDGAASQKEGETALTQDVHFAQEEEAPHPQEEPLANGQEAEDRLATDAAEPNGEGAVAVGEVEALAVEEQGEEPLAAHEEQAEEEKIACPEMEGVSGEDAVAVGEAEAIAVEEQAEELLAAHEERDGEGERASHEAAEGRDSTEPVEEEVVAVVLGELGEGEEDVSEACKAALHDDDEAPSTWVAETGRLKTVVLLGEGAEVRQSWSEIPPDLVSFICLDPPAREALLADALCEQEGRKIDSDLIVAVRAKVYEYYKQAGHPLVRIVVPPQDITDGVLQLVVEESKVGQIRIEGDQFFSKRQILNMIQLRPGDPVDAGVLLSDIDWINRSPYRHADLVLAPGDEKGLTDIEIRMSDRLPLRIYMGADNTGNSATEYTRLFGGFTWANAFNLDHTFTYQGTVSPNFSEFYSHTLNYVAPLSNRHVFVVFGGYSEVKPDMLGLTSHGTSLQASARYQIPFGEVGTGKMHEIVFGGDYKNTNNNLTYLGLDQIPIVAKRVDYVQLMVGYNYGFQNRSHRVSISGSLYGSPGETFGDSSKRNFDRLRPNAANYYLYGRLYLEYTYTVSPNLMSFYFCEQGQMATNPLLPGEQFGVGGYNTVRGYGERVINADDAFVSTFEVRSPKFPLFSKIWGGKKYPDALDLHAFVDYAYTHELSTQPQQPTSPQLLSTGFGLNYSLDPFISLRFDWGVRLLTVLSEEVGGNHVHFGLIVGY